MRNKIRKFISVAVVTLVIIGVAAPIALASTALDILNQWEASGYPDDIGGAYSVDGTADNLALLVLDPRSDRISELSYLFGYDVLITPCKYSYNELKQVHVDTNNKENTVKSHLLKARNILVEEIT